jgi:hypothetical protein
MWYDTWCSTEKNRFKDSGMRFDGETRKFDLLLADWL